MLVLHVVVLFAANMSVIIMSLEFGRRPTKKFKTSSAVASRLWIQASISPSACPLEIHVLWLLHKVRHGKLQHYSHSQRQRNNVHLTKKRGQCFVDAPSSHRSQCPLSDNKEKPQPHLRHNITFGCAICFIF